MYQKGNFYRNKSFYTNKGLTLQKKPQDPPKIIDQYYVPIYKNYFLNTKQLMPYTPNISFIDFKKKCEANKNIGELILDEVTAYGKNLTDVTKIEIDPEMDTLANSNEVRVKVCIQDTSTVTTNPSEYGIFAQYQLQSSSACRIINQVKYTFTAIEGGWTVNMSPGVNTITTLYSATLTYNACNIDSSGNLTTTKYTLANTFPIQNEYKGYSVQVTNALALYFYNIIRNGEDNVYLNLQIKVYF